MAAGRLTVSLPARGEEVRQLGLALPPARMRPVRAGRPLKRWRYVGIYGPELMVCAAEVHVGPLGQRFWGVAEPDGRLLASRAMFGSGGVALSGDGLRVRATSGAGGIPGSTKRARVEIDFSLRGGPPAVESVSASGRRGYVWTRKLAGARASGSVSVAGERRAFEAEAVIDDTAGYHARHTVWCWSAGVGRGARGERIGWNLVEGVNDDLRASERTLWIDGEPAEVGPVRFRADLRAIDFSEGGGLRFLPWSELSHRTRLGLLRSDYRQPFGEFAGELPGGIRLVEGRGVTERHEAWW